MAENEKSLPFGMARKLDRICDRFEAEFQGGKQPRIEDYLTDAAGEERDALLKSLLQIELELLRRAGQEPDPAAYLSRFPGSPAVIDSVFTEHEQRTGQAADLSRTRIGPTPSAATGRKETISFGRASADTSTDLQQPRKDGTALSKGDTLGRFEILKVLGEGGFGRVYHANDPQLDREVALKVPHVAALGSPEMLERFMQEARSAANLLHANICPVHEIGEFDGQPYIVMAFIDGKSLSAFINPNKPLSERQVCLIVRKVALAIEAAHRSGVIHRDLKPDNIMIDRSRREPVVMDFGLARRETRGETQLTQVGQIMGTPTYMPPEQAKGDIENIGPHSDVYSLGVILYEMLTGERPFTGSIAEVLASILKDQPTPPSTHRPDLSPELEAICLKAMAKDPGGRFSSMAEFAHALGDFLKQAGTSGPNPVSRPGRTKEQQENEDHAGLTAFFEAPRLGKALDRYLSRKNAGLWSSRSPLTKILIGTAALALLAFLSVILFRTKHGTVQLEILDPSINVTFAGETITVDNDGKLIEITPGPHHLLVSYEGLEIPVEKPFEVKRGETTALRVTRIGSEVHVLQPGDPVPDSGPPPVAVASTELLHTLASDPAHVWDIAFSPDGNMIATANDGSSVKIWNADTGELVHTLSEFESPVFCVAWSPDGKLLATGDSHRSTSGKQKSGTAALWSTSDWKKTTTVTDTKAVRSLAFTPDGSRLIGGLGSTMPEDSLLRMEESYTRRSSKSGSGRSVPSSLPFKMWQWGGMLMFDLAAEKAIETPAVDSTRIVAVAVSPDGKSFATCGYRGEFKLRDTTDGTTLVDLVEPPGSQYAVNAVAFAPGGDILAGGVPNGFVIYDVQHKRELARNATAGEVYALSFSDDGRILATGHQGQPIQLWDATSGELLTTLEVDWKRTTDIEFQPGGHRLAASGESRGDVCLWDLDLSPSPADQSETEKSSGTSGSTTPSQPPADYDLIAIGEWVSVPVTQDLIKKELIGDGEGAAVKGDILELTSSLSIPQIQGKNILLRCRVNRVKVPRSVGFELRTDVGRRVTTWINEKNDVGMFTYLDGKQQELAERNRVAKMSEWGEVVFAAIDDDLITFTAGKRVHAVKCPNPAVSGYGRLWVNRGVVQFKDIEYMVLDPQAAPSSAAALKLPCWTEADIQAGKITAPDLSMLTPIWDDDFSTASKSGSGAGNDSMVISPKDGKLHFDIKKGTWYWWETLRKIPRKDSYAVRIVASANSKGPVTSGWKLVLTDGPGKGVNFQFGKDGRFHISSRAGGDHREFAPISHPAIKLEPNQNELLVIYRSPRLEIYVNGVAVCSPVSWESNLKRAFFSIGLSGTSGGHAEYDSLTVWDAAEIPALEDRISSGVIPSPTAEDSTPATSSTTPIPRPPLVEPPELKSLQSRTAAATGKPSSDSAVVALRKELRDFRLKHYGTPWAIEAAELMTRLRWPVDEFKRESIDPYELKIAGIDDASRAPGGLVHIMGDSRLNHWSKVEYVDFSPDGKSLVSASHDGSTVVWDVLTADQKTILTGLPTHPRCAVYSPDGKFIATCSGWKGDEIDPGTSEIIIWNPEQGRIEKKLIGGHTMPVRRVNWSGNGQKVVSWGYDNQVIVWDSRTGGVLKKFAVEGTAGGMVPVCWKTNTLLVPQKLGLYQLWDLDTLKPHVPPEIKYEGLKNPLRFSHDGTLLATMGGKESKTLLFWDLRKGTPAQSIENAGPIIEARFSPDDRILLTGDYDNDASFWDVKTGKPATGRKTHEEGNQADVLGVAFSPDGKYYAYCCSDGGIRIRDTKTQRLVYGDAAEETNFKAMFAAAKLSADGTVLATQGWDGTLMTWDALTGKFIARVGGMIYTPRSIDISPDGSIVGLPRQWRSSPMLFIDSRKGGNAKPWLRNFYGNECAFSPDGQHVAVGTQESKDRVIVHNYQTGKTVATFRHPWGTAGRMCYSPDGKHLISLVSNGKNTMVFNPFTGEQLPSVQGHAGPVSGFVFLPDGKRLITASSAARELKVWDFEKRTEIKELISKSLQDKLTGLYFPTISPDGRLLAVTAGVSRNFYLLVFDTETLELKHQFHYGPDRGITAGHANLFFSIEGRHIIRADKNGTCKYFRLGEMQESPVKVQAAAATPATTTPAPTTTTSPTPVPTPTEKPVSAAVEKQAQFEIIWMKNLTGLNWEFEPGQTEEELVKQLARKKRTGMIPVSISGYADQNGQPRLCSLWTAGHSPVIARFNKTRDELQDVYQNRPSGFFLTWRDFYRIDEETRTAFVFVATGNTGGLHTKSNFTRDGFQKELDEYREKKYRPTMMSGFVSGSGAIRYYGQWRSDRLPYDYKLDISRQECETQILELQKLGHQLIWLDAYTKGSKRYYSYVTVKPAVPAVWEASFAVPASQLEELMKKQRNRRFFPSVINVE